MVLTSWPSNVNSGGSCSHPLKRSWPHLPHWSRPPMYTCMPNFVQIGLSCHPWVVKTPKFYRILNFCMLWRLVETKTNVDAQLQTFPTNNIKTTSKSMSLTQTLSSKSVTDKYTKINIFSSPGGVQSQIVDLEHVLSSRKHLGVWRIVSPLGSGCLIKYQLQQRQGWEYHLCRVAGKAVWSHKACEFP